MDKISISDLRKLKAEDLKKAELLVEKTDLKTDSKEIICKVVGIDNPKFKEEKPNQGIHPKGKGVVYHEI